MSYWIYKYNGHCSSDMMTCVYFPVSGTGVAHSISTPLSTVQMVQVDVHRSGEDDDDDEYDDVLRDEGMDGEDLASVADEGRFKSV